MTEEYLIVNAFSHRNAGDAAIVLSTAELIRRRGDSQVTNASRYYEDDDAFYSDHDIATCPPVIPFPPRTASQSGLLRAIKFGFGALAALFTSIVFSHFPTLGRRLANWLSLDGLVRLFDCHRAIICGGGYLYSSRRTVNLTLFHSCLCVKVCELAGRRPVMMPQSFGPFTRRLDRAMVGWSFSDVETLVARDIDGRNQALSLSRRAQPVELCPDVAFIGWRSAGGSIRAERRDRPIIGIAPMDWTWARSVERERALSKYIAGLTNVARLLTDSGILVRLYGSSMMSELAQNDLDVAERIAAGVDSALVQVDPENVSGNAPGLFATFAGLDALIGTRLHSSIISLAAGTPAIALGYQPKAAGTYSQLGLSQLCFDVETFDPESTASLAVRLSSPDEPAREEVIESVELAQQSINKVYEGLLSK